MKEKGMEGPFEKWLYEYIFSKENYSPKSYVFLVSTWTNLVCCKDTYKSFKSI